MSRELYEEMVIIHTRQRLTTGHTHLCECLGCHEMKPVVTADNTYLCYECAVKRDCTND